MSIPWIIAYIIQWIGILLTMFVVLRLMKLIGQYALKVEELEKRGGAPASIFKGKSFPKINEKAINTGEVVTINDQTPDPVTLLILDTKCSACGDLLERMSKRKDMKQMNRIVAVINKDKEDIIKPYHEKLSMMDIPLIVSDKITGMFYDNKTPFPFSVVIEKGIVKHEGLAAQLIA